MDGVRATLSSFAAERIFCQTKAVTCLAAIKFLSVRERECFKLHFLVTLEFKEKQTSKNTHVTKQHTILNCWEIAVRC